MFTGPRDDNHDPLTQLDLAWRRFKELEAKVVVESSSPLMTTPGNSSPGWSGGGTALRSCSEHFEERECYHDNGRGNGGTLNPKPNRVAQKLGRSAYYAENSQDVETRD